MIISYVKLKSDQFGSEDENFIVDEPLSKIGNTDLEIPYDTPLADKIFEAVAHNKTTFVCNDIKYEILDYKMDNRKFEKRFNKYRKITRIVNTIKNKKIVIYVTYGKLGCETKGHKVESAQAIVKAKDTSEPITISIEFCPKCDIYFINYQSLNAYQRKYHILLFRMAIFPPHKTLFEGEWGREAHELKILGYSVAANSGLTISERREILTYAIDNNIFDLTKYKVKTHLEWLIRRGENNSHWIDSVPEWESDLLFVNNYNSKNEKLFTNAELARK